MLPALRRLRLLRTFFSLLHQAYEAFCAAVPHTRHVLHSESIRNSEFEKIGKGSNRPSDGQQAWLGRNLNVLTISEQQEHEGKQQAIPGGRTMAMS